MGDSLGRVDGILFSGAAIGRVGGWNGDGGCDHTDGFTTHDLARCQLVARMLALVYDWWNIFVRLADPNLHREAVASRPLFLSAIATRTRHARQTTIRITSSHAKAKPAAGALAAVASFLRGLAQNAEQLAHCKSGASSSPAPSAPSLMAA